MHTDTEYDDGFDDGDDTPKRSKKNGHAASTKPRRFRETIDVKLTKQEFTDHVTQLVDAMDARDVLAAEAASAAANFKAQIKLQDDDIDTLRKAVQTKCARIEVELQERFIHQTGTVQVLRVDTGELVRERPMTGAERAQPELPLGDSP